VIVAAVPLKRLDRVKSRLAPRLSTGERSELMLGLLERVVGGLEQSRVVHRIALVTPERAVARQLDIVQLPDRNGLNPSLRGAVDWALDLGAQSLLIVPADLSLLTPDDVRSLVEASGGTSGVTIAPTHDGGTGALLLTPPDAISPSFGVRSFRRHLHLAAASGMAVRQVSRQGFLYDVDTVEDLESLMAVHLSHSPRPSER